ncbi:MAG: molybdopterin-dependent oxidoreductase [Nitrospira sp. CR1.3]|nr:molybdopterin-dependent oxidoreductase [Nitrospira sp. CR1.3]
MNMGEGRRSVSRRSWMKRLLAGLAAGLLVNRRPAAAKVEEEREGLRETGPLTVRVTRPFDAETPVREFTSFLTPNHRFFVRSHFGPPDEERISEANWRLRVDGLVERPAEFRLKDLHQMDAATITAVVQCSGNGRAFHRPKVPGVQWERGAVGNAQWTGVRLRDLLTRAGVKDQARHVQLQGADRPVVASVPLFIRSIPLEKALHPDTILAYEMNGRPLPLLHGAPLRVITPGWMADSCIKWLSGITVQAEEAKGYYMQTAYRVPAKPVEPTATTHVPSIPVEAMVVKSLVAAPEEGETVKVGPIMIQGVAWSGEAGVVKVEVSLDEGKSWEPARLVGEDHPYAWRQWQLAWKPAGAGTVTILCRATDARGDRQPATTPWNPSGFLWNGWDRVTVTVAGD